MMAKKIMPVLLSFMIILSTVCVCAEDFSEYTLSVEYNYEKNSVSMSGAVSAARNFVTVIILNKGYSAEDLKNNETDTDKIFYMMQQDTNNGEYRFDAEYDDDTETGFYNAYLMADGIEGIIDIGALKIVSGKAYENSIKKLNGLAAEENLSEFKKWVETDNENLGFDLTLYKKLSGSDVLREYMNYVKTNPLKAEASDENIKTFNTFVLMEGLEESVIDNINDYLADTVVDKQLYSDYLSYGESGGRQKYITSKMSGKDMDSVADFEKLLKQAFVLAEVRYSNGYESVKDVIEKYGNEVGITDNASNSVYKAICGVDYKDADALLAAYKRLKADASANNATSGGSGSSGGSGGSGVAYMNGEYFESESGAVSPVKTRFVDIEGVDWAAEAILALADRGIINGRAEGLFEPDEYVTREEFVKIIVGAMGYTDESYDKNVFSDVKEDDWFCSYVNIAYNRNLVKGMGNGIFGSGQFITRQDMAVMVYNALSEREAGAQNGSILFEDRDEIADYAVQAVGALYEMEIINGISETEFEPLGYTTRAQAAKVIYGISEWI